MKERLPYPNLIDSQTLHRVFEVNGYEVTPRKLVSLDLIDIMVPLLHMLQTMQFWGHLADHEQNPGFDISLEGDPVGISVHAADKGQQVGVVFWTTLRQQLNMPKNLLANLMHYGKSPESRRERLEDTEFAQLQNELLDLHGKTLCDVLFLILPSRPSPPSENEDE